MLFFPGDFIALAIVFTVLAACVIFAAIVVQADIQYAYEKYEALEQARKDSVEEPVRAKSVTVNAVTVHG